MCADSVPIYPQRRACGSGDDPSVRLVTLYHAEGCHLCERAREVVAAVREEVSFELVEVDIAGDDELERRYREWLPVVEIDGQPAFTYFVQPDALRQRLGASAAASPPGL
jgi:hypothetical protein